MLGDASGAKEGRLHLLMALSLSDTAPRSQLTQAPASLLQPSVVTSYWPASYSSMGRTAQVNLSSLKNCLVNLPLSIYAPLVERGISPQSLIVELAYTAAAVPGAIKSNSGGAKSSSALLNKVYVGWTGLPSAVVGVSSNQVRGGKGELERLDMDPQFAAMLGNGLVEGTPVNMIPLPSPYVGLY